MDVLLKCRAEESADNCAEERTKSRAYVTIAVNDHWGGRRWRRRRRRHVVHDNRRGHRRRRMVHDMRRVVMRRVVGWPCSMVHSGTVVIRPRRCLLMGRRLLLHTTMVYTARGGKGCSAGAILPLTLG